MTSLLHKTCIACKKSTPLECFSPDKRARDGKQSCCRKCYREKRNQAYYADLENSREKQRRYYRENTEKILESGARSREKNRDAVLERKREYYNKVKVDPEWQAAKREERSAGRRVKKEYDRDYREKNQEKCNIKSKQWRARNPEKRRSISKAYKARRRAIEKGGDSTAKIHAWEFSAPKVCHWCAEPCAEKYHTDHYHPLSKGGKHEVSNLVIACPTCNLRKSNKDPEEFAKEMKNRAA